MVATFPTPHPFPVAPGGLAHASAERPRRGPPAAYVRQPDLGSPPAIFGIGGFGSGSGAMIVPNGSAADQSQGLVSIRCGINPLGVGVLQLSFPLGVTAGQYVAFADWAALSLNASTPVLQINWNANRALSPNEVLTLAYQWAVSQ